MNSLSNSKLFVSLAALVLASCGGSPEEGDTDSTTEYESSSYSNGYVDSEETSEPAGEEREPFDEDAAREAAENDMAFESYSGIGRPYGCTDDCSGHEAGFEWRRNNGYVTMGKSRSFHEGAQAFEDEVDQRVQDMQDEYDNGEELDY